MDSSCVVSVDPGDDRPASLCSGLEAVPGDEFSLERGPKRLGHSIIVTRASSSDRLADLVVVTELAVVARRVLTRFNWSSQHWLM